MIMRLKNIQIKLARPSLSFGVFLVVVIAMSVGAAAVSAHGINQAWRLATTHQLEPYTALYFDSPARLPLYAPAGKAEAVPFRIANHEGSPRTYQYQILFTVSGTEAVKSGSVTLASGQDVRMFANFAMPQPNEQGQLVIEIVGTSQRLTLRSQS